ncbi:MAG: sugar phosphate isomerase/epimerase [Anaerolineaceae bacterium]|nr:sugar phosphate isomerase/epimerase [Anaerolineaceae bacterium]
MKLSFTTLGCPNWDLDTLCRRGQEYGFSGVDFRGYLGDLDVTRLPAFSTHAAQTKRRLADAGLETSGVSTSIRVCEAAQLTQNIEEARRTIETARGLGAPNIRVFGGGDLGAHSREELAQNGCACLEQILALDGASDLLWLFETHDNWVKASDCRLLLDSIPQPAFGALWDIGNRPPEGGETPAEIYAAIGPRIGYTHLKDAIYEPGHPQAVESGWRYVLPGEGQIPLAEAVHLLRSKGYAGWLVFEHEKRWHPNLPEPEEAFPAYVHWASKILA